MRFSGGMTNKGIRTRCKSPARMPGHQDSGMARRAHACLGTKKTFLAGINLEPEAFFVAIPASPAADLICHKSRVIAHPQQQAGPLLKKPGHAQEEQAGEDGSCRAA